MTKLYHDAGAWVVPGEQGRGAERVDVPGSPAELAAWLNDRDVQPVAAAPAEAPEAADDEPTPRRGDRYVSPLGADATIQRIDGSMIAEAIRRMTDGKALGDILGSLVDRIRAIGGRDAQ
ncbi:MAG: hypothetical protein AB7O91_03935 [Sphingomonas sp.]